MTVELPKLPYAMDALAPYMSRETLDYHYNKHHRGYVDKLNELIEGSKYAHATLEDIVRSADGAVFNSAAQVWNHNFFWQSMAPHAGNKPVGQLADKLQQSFGSFDKFCTAFAHQALEHFGSGWTWLVENNDRSLSVISTSNAATPITSDHQRPLLACDTWEHAYYIDYRNERARYLEGFWHVVDWEVVAQRLNSKS